MDREVALSSLLLQCKIGFYLATYPFPDTAHTLQFPLRWGRSPRLTLLQEFQSLQQLERRRLNLNRQIRLTHIMLMPHTVAAVGNRLVVMGPSDLRALHRSSRPSHLHIFHPW
jgi:hypothetical protein